MVCVYCGSETSVSNSRRQKRNNQIWRRRQCTKCKAIFTTHEGADLSSLLVVNDKGRHIPFLEDILFVDILRALSHRKDCYRASREVTATIIKQLLVLPSKPVFEPRQISAAAASVLERLDQRAWLRFAAEHPSVSG